MKPLIPPRRSEPIRIDTSLAIVNIVLLLIFFFVIAGQEISQDTGFDLAETRELPLDRLPSPILIVDADHNWVLDGAAISPELLAGSMAGRGETLYLMIDRKAPASTLINVLGRPETAGFEIRLVTIHEDRQ
ncbi:MAG: biopolymer transporter ExbD [Paracoccus sp. (in: a-proteobacteria)]|uniref:ExbD/TolR family protein n=1 Tax=Paracoccus sp. TaxID=267 RepID=UPI0026DEE209|nr:biopolymer transporter ExbD [Paracoccus sp. (in: a-proteobacteria)]MDO5622776.1 biopolymer transporter ExbD [Paracoccus sp. (in: a-proteobacteria)]